MRLAPLGAAVLVCAFALAGSAAEAKPKHHGQGIITCDMRGCSDVREAEVSAPAPHAGRATRAPVNSDRAATVIGGRPAGCPFKFCGCEASLYVFGKIVPALNLAANWIRKFPRAHPAPGMAAARSGHVMILVSHVSGNDWLVHDGNSGGHKTREHVRSISGYVIVDPRARTAGL